MAVDNVGRKWEEDACGRERGENSVVVVNRVQLPYRSLPATTRGRAGIRSGGGYPFSILKRIHASSLSQNYIEISGSSSW